MKYKIPAHIKMNATIKLGTITNGEEYELDEPADTSYK